MAKTKNKNDKRTIEDNVSVKQSQMKNLPFGVDKRGGISPK